MATKRGTELSGVPGFPAAAAAKLAEAWITTAEEVDALARQPAGRDGLAAGVPVVFSVPVFSYWFAPPAGTTGDIRLPLIFADEWKGGHAMCLVGYEDDASVPYAYLQRLGVTAYVAFAE